MSEPWDEQKMISYLLGALPVAETERHDELSLTDEEFVARLGAVENDLVDAYVRGELAGERLERFNAYYLASPRRHEKVRLAQTFVRFADAVAVNKAEASRQPALPVSISKKKPAPSSLWLTLFKPRPALQWGLVAAALLLLLASSYFLFENARLKNQMAQTQAERAALQQHEQELQRQLDDARTADAETAKELADVRERLAQLEAQQPNQQNENTAANGGDMRIASFTLAPPLRGGPVAQITLPVETDLLALRLQLEANDFSIYQAALKNPASGQIIWRSGRLKANPASNSVTVRLRAGLLKPQNYTLELSGVQSNGAAEIISSYTFKVVFP